MPSYQNNTFDDIVYRNSTYYGTAAYLRSNITNQANSWQPVSGEDVIRSLNDCVSTIGVHTTITETYGWDNYLRVTAGNITASYTILEGESAGETGENREFRYLGVSNGLSLGPDYFISVRYTDSLSPDILLSSFNSTSSIEYYNRPGLLGDHLICRAYGLLDTIQILTIRETREINSMQFLTTGQYYVGDGVGMFGKQLLTFGPGITEPTHTIVDIENNASNSFSFSSQDVIYSVITFSEGRNTYKYSIRGNMDIFCAQIPIHGVKTIYTYEGNVTRTYYTQH